MKILFLSIIFFLVFSPAFSAKQSNFIIAKVNNKAITNSEVNNRYRFILLTSRLHIKSSFDKKILYQQIVDKMIDEELIRQKGKELKIVVNASEVTEAAEIIALQRKQSLLQFRGFFIKQGLSFDSYLKQVESKILWSRIVLEALRSKVKVTNVEIGEFLEQHKLDVSVKNFLLAEILISKNKNSLHLAKKLAIELRQGADFKYIVRQFSSSAISEDNGMVGWVSQFDIDEKVYLAILKLKKGEYSDPILLSDGYHIFKLLDVKAKTQISDQDLAIARKAIFNRKLQILAKGYLMDLRKKSFIEINNRN